jgi:hypothetical protein
LTDSLFSEGFSLGSLSEPAILPIINVEIPSWVQINFYPNPDGPFEIRSLKTIFIAAFI